MVEYRRSVCSSGVEVSYFWHACQKWEDHVEAAVEALMDAIRAPGRLWNPWVVASARGAFKSRIKRACAGELQPVDEIKHIDGAHPAELFEIRWQDIGVIDRVPTGERRHEIPVRLLHAEPSHLSLTVIGLHAHEKVVHPEDSRRTREAQDAEVEVACQTYWTVIQTPWGFR